MPRRHPKRIGRRLAAKYKKLRKWKLCWQKDKPGMEAARQLNVVKAWEYYDGLNDALRTELNNWPDLMTSEQFVERLKSYVPLLGKGRRSAGYDWKSFRQRLVRLHFMLFDPLTRTWINRCRNMD